MEKMTIGSEHNVQFRIWGELEELPTIDSTLKLYEKTKRMCSMTEFGFSAVERGLNFLVDTLRIKRLAGSKIDVFAGKKIADLKDSYPLLQERPSKIIRKTRQRSLRYMKRKTHSALDNFLGKSLTFGIDSMLWVTENTLQLLGPKTPTTSEKHVQTSPISVDLNRDRILDEKITERVWVDEITDENRSKIDLFRKFMLFPMSVFVCFLKETRAIINGSGDHKKARCAARKSARSVGAKSITPEKLEEIQGRRKLSPKKRLPPSSFLSNLKNFAFRLFGLPTSHVKQTDIREFLTCSKHKSLNECSLLTCEKKKRKHPGLSSDSGDDLINMDLDGYLSEDDPDFELTDEESTDDTIETEDEVSEGDLKVAFTEDGMFKMLEDKSDTNKVADEKQGDNSSKQTDCDVLKPSFEIGDTKIPKTMEKTDSETQTKPVEKTSIPVQKVSDGPVASLQPSKPTLESTVHSQPLRPPSASNPPAQQLKSPRANKNKQGKSGGPKTTSPASKCESQENKKKSTSDSKEI